MKKLDKFIDKAVNKIGDFIGRLLCTEFNIGEKYSWTLGLMYGLIIGFITCTIIVLTTTYIEQIMFAFAVMVGISVFVGIIKLGIVIARWYLNRRKIPDILNYTPMLFDNVWHIIYENYESMPPLRRTVYQDDLEGKIIDKSTYQLSTMKINTATIDRDTIEDYRMLFQTLLDRRLFPEDIYGNPITNPLYLSSVMFEVKKCQDAGRFFIITIIINTRSEKIKEAANKAGSNTNTAVLEDEEL